MADMMKSNGLGFWGREEELEREQRQDPGKRVVLRARWIAAGDAAACIDGDRRRKSPAEEKQKTGREEEEGRRRTGREGKQWISGKGETTYGRACGCVIMAEEHAEQRLLVGMGG